MSGPSTLLAIAQTGRNEDFQIITKILLDDKKLWVSKRALNNKSVPHVESMIKTHSLISKSAAKGFKVVDIRLANTGEVIFPYIDGPTFDQSIYKLIVSGDTTSVLKTLKDLFGFIDQLSSDNKHTGEITESKYDFCTKIVERYNKTSSFMSPAILDLNLDNFMISENDVYIIDYEWRFDIPLPADYIKTRVLVNFFSKYEDSFAYLPSSTRPFHLIKFYETSMYIPEPVYMMYEKWLNKKSIDSYLYSEVLFHTYVKGETSTLTHNATSFTYVSKGITAPRQTISDEFLNEKITRENKELEVAELTSRVSDLTNAPKEFRLTTKQKLKRIIKKIVVR